MNADVSFETKILTPETLAEGVARLPRPIVMTNGVFDILHRGHVTYLARARALGASLVVAVNSDASVRMLGKGEDRPINRQEDRAAVVAALESVDAVVVFKEKVPLAVLEAVRPDIYVKGADYAGKPLPERDLVQSWGGRVELIAFEHDTSTTKTLERIRASKA